MYVYIILLNISFPFEIAPPYRLFCSHRLILVCMIFLCLLNLYLQRVGMSVAIVCMVNHTAIRQSNDSISNSSSICHGLSFNKTSPSKDGPFKFDKLEQGHILGGFFYGYLISQIPGGLLAEKFGGKKIFLIFSSISTLATLLTPLGAELGFGYLIALRVLVGFGSVI